MIADLLNTASGGAKSRYAGFLMSLRGVLATFTNTPIQDMRVFPALRVAGADLAQTFLEEERERFRSDLWDVQQTVAGAAHQDMEANPQEPVWSEQGEEYANWYAQEVGAQAWRDINALTVARRRGIDPSFVFLDRSSRAFQADGHVQQLYRHGLLSFGVGTYADVASDLGAETVTVTHPEADHPHNGMALRLTEEGEQPSLNDVLDQVFHPNSRAFLTTEPV